MAKQVWSYTRIVKSDLLLFVKRWWLPKYFKGSAHLYGNVSSVEYKTKEKLNKKCNEITSLLHELEMQARDRRLELKDVESSDRYDRGGETIWEKEDVSYLKTFKDLIEDPGDYYKSVINPHILKKYGLNGNTNAKKSKKDVEYKAIPKGMQGGDRSIYVLNGESDAALADVESHTGADHAMKYRPPKEEKSTKGNKKQNWKNRRKGESEDEYDERMDKGDSDE